MDQPLSSPVLDLATAERTAVFRAVESVLRGDPVLSRIVDSWQSYQGDPDDDNPTSKTGADVALILTPSESDTAWYSPDSQQEDFVVRVQVEVNSWCLDDPMNLWRAVEKAFYVSSNADEADAVRQSLVDAGCQTGQPLFSPPQFGMSVNDKGLPSGRFVAAGEIKLKIFLTINP